MLLQNAGKLLEVPTPENGDVCTSPPLSSSIAESPVPPDVALLLQASLRHLPEGKPRLVTGVRSPHEMLKLIRDVGADIFDADLAIAAANVGVALDFVFPLSPNHGPSEEGKKKDVGHNLYDHVYAHQYGRLSDCLAGAAESRSQSQFPAPLPICPCIACSPCSPASHILHSKVDVQSHEEETDRNGNVMYGLPRSRGYLHHLLHTHEMSAHAMLVAHNLAVLDRFLSGVRDFLLGGDGNDIGEGEDRVTRFAVEVNRFEGVYDESMEVLRVAKECWHEVDLARGKGRLGREKEKQASIEAGGV